MNMLSTPLFILLLLSFAVMISSRHILVETEDKAEDKAEAGQDYADADYAEDEYAADGNYHDHAAHDYQYEEYMDYNDDKKARGVGPWGAPWGKHGEGGGKKGSKKGGKPKKGGKKTGGKKERKKLKGKVREWFDRFLSWPNDIEYVLCNYLVLDLYTISFLLDSKEIKIVKYQK